MRLNILPVFHFCLLTFALTFLSTYNLAAQNVQLTVVDAVDLMPLEGVDIWLMSPPGKKVMNVSLGKSNLKGRIPLQEAYNQTRIFRFEHPDYRTQEISFGDIRAYGYKVFMEGSTLHLNEVVFTANKGKENLENLPQEIQVIKARDISFNNPMNTGEMLAQTGAVFVQTSQFGGGSPNLRGFEANKVLLVVDGVRMNNAIYRGGHLQNAITIDPNMLERTEVQFGPASVIYGSDALGGVMHFFTRRPTLSSSGKAEVKTNLFSRWSSAASERTGHADINIGLEKWGFLTSISGNGFDDLKSGKKHHKDYPDYGKRSFYAASIAGNDTMIANQDEHIQVASGYNQYDFLQKIYFLPNASSSHLLNVQYSTSSNIPRYDRLSEMPGGTLRYADWHYGPQKRFFTSYHGNWYKDSSFFDSANLTLAYQNITESRINRRFGKNELRNRKENVQVYSANFDLSKSLKGNHTLRYGLEYIMNFVSSDAFQTDISDGMISNLDTRYPDGGSIMQLASAYISHRWDASEKFHVHDGLRFTDVFLNSNFEDKSFFPFLPDEIKQHTAAVSGSVGLVYHPEKSWKISLLGATGFRAPNVDDVGKTFDSSPGNVILPTNTLNPEYSYNAELLLSKKVGEFLSLEGNVFYTYLNDIIVVRNSSIEGQDSILFEGVLSQVQANINSGEAAVYGFNVDLQFYFLNHFTLYSTLTLSRGTSLSEGVPLDHIPPIFGKTGVKFEMKQIRAEIYSHYNGWKRTEDFSPGGEDNSQYATAEGFPSWYTLNAKASWAFNENFRLQFGLENLLDKHYRRYASGISAPGRNFIAAIRVNF